MVNFSNLRKSDVALLHAYARGDAAAFETLYKRHKDGLFNFIFRSVARQAIAEEIAQDVWLAVIQVSSRYNPGAATFRTWLYRIARNKVVDFFRRAGNHHYTAVDVADFAVDGQQEVCGKEPGGAAANSVETNLLVSQLFAALDQLPTEQREAFILQQEGFTAKEIANITGASMEAVKSRLRYAKSTARERLGAGE